MTDWRSAFEQLLRERLIPEFCSDPERGFEISGFRKSSVSVSDDDARYFLEALKAGLIEHSGHGRYRCSRSAAQEQFFWEGRKAQQPRSFTLSLEPVITVGALARLHFDYRWPPELIATQSADWAFDVVAFLPGHTDEFIAGEVKRTRAEVDQLIQFMTEFCRYPNATEPASGKVRNAYKKVAGLRARHAPRFWALGPDGYSRTFEVAYDPNQVVHLAPIGNDGLKFPQSDLPRPHHHVA